MTRPPALAAFTLVASFILSSCANPHFFPRLRPLFPGLAETGLSAPARNSLARAKADFLLLKQGQPPQHAKFVSTIPYTRSRVYSGQGYRLTMVRQDNIYPHKVGAEIVVSPSITGGKAYHYDEVDEVAE